MKWLFVCLLLIVVAHGMHLPTPESEDIFYMDDIPSVPIPLTSFQDDYYEDSDVEDTSAQSTPPGSFAEKTHQRIQTMLQSREAIMHFAGPFEKTLQGKFTIETKEKLQNLWLRSYMAMYQRLLSGSDNVLDRYSADALAIATLYASLVHVYLAPSTDVSLVQQAMAGYFEMNQDDIDAMLDCYRIIKN